MNTTGLHKIGDVLSKNSPIILTGVSVAGLITTTVLAVKATPKALLILENEKNNRVFTDEDVDVVTLPKIDVVKLTYKCYIPATIAGAVTIACIVGNNTINARRYAALAGVYSLTETAYKEYQAKVKETVGETKARDIRREMAKDKMNANPVDDKEVIFTGNGETLCYDVLSGRYFKSDRDRINKAINQINKQMRDGMFVSVSELYYELGLPGTKMGDMMGWHIDNGYVDADFGSQLTENGVPCLVLDYSTEPLYFDYH